MSVIRDLFVSSALVVPMALMVIALELLLLGNVVLLTVTTAGIVICLWALGLAIRWRALSMTLTTRSLILESGVFHRAAIEMALDTVQEIRSQEPFVGRLFRYGTVEIQLFGSLAQRFGPVRDPRVLRQQISTLRWLSELRSNRRRRWPGQERDEDIRVWDEGIGVSSEREVWERYAAGPSSAGMFDGYLTARIQGRLYLVTPQTSLEWLLGRILGDSQLRIEFTSGQQAGKGISVRTVLLVDHVPREWRGVLPDNARFVR